MPKEGCRTEEGRGVKVGAGEGRSVVKAPPAPKPPPKKKLPPPLAPSTLQKLRERLEIERERHLRQADELTAEADLLASEREQGDTQFDEESGEGDTVNVERERDLALSATARQTVDDIDRALSQMSREHVRAVHHVRRSHPARAARGAAVGGAVREVQGPRRAAPLSESRRDPHPNAPAVRTGPTRWVIGDPAIVAIDQLTKIWAVAALADGPKSVIGDTVEFNLTRNGGARSAASRASRRSWRSARSSSRSCSSACCARPPTGCSCSASRSCSAARSATSWTGSSAPGFLRGHVVDFVAVGWWPVFNVADSCVTIGAVLLILRSLRAPL